MLYEVITTGINKLLNLLYKTLLAYPYTPPAADSYLGILLENNRLMQEQLNALKPGIKQLNTMPDDTQTRQQLRYRLQQLQPFTNYYLIKENLLFPLIEKHSYNFV